MPFDGPAPTRPRRPPRIASAECWLVIALLLVGAFWLTLALLVFCGWLAAGLGVVGMLSASELRHRFDRATERR